MVSLNDLKLELWLRKRNSGELTWTTRDGGKIPIRDMTRQHLENTIAMLERNQEAKDQYDEIAGAYEAYKWEHL